jgi:hypothetical protein
MKSKKVVISLGEGENISGVFSVPEGLASAGYITMRFNFPYKEKGKKHMEQVYAIEQSCDPDYSPFSVKNLTQV